MERKRGFEIAKGFENLDLNLPKRSTMHSAGYDFEAAEDTIISKEFGKVSLVKTGIKSYMEDNEVLLLYDRSSNPKKKGIMLANSVGVIDKDYYGNSDNDGHIMFAFLNISGEEVVIKKGERIGQGVFTKFYKVDEDKASEERTGGLGSTGK